MMIFNTKKYLLLFAFLAVNSIAFSQSKREKKEPHPQLSIIIEDEIRPFIVDNNTRIPQVSPEGVENEDLQYFLRERKGITHFNIHDKRGGQQSVRLDSLILYHRKDIDDFIINYNKTRASFQTGFKKGVFKIIHDKIDSLRTIKINKRSAPYLDGVYVLIQSLPASREKILLLLDYARLEIRNETYSKDVYNYCNEASRLAKDLIDLTDKGLAYFDIGDFAHSLKANDFAIKMYYFARESIGDADINDKEKFYQQGEICSAIAQLFYSLQLTHGFEEEGNYQVNAIQYYYKAGYYNEADATALWGISDRSFLWVKNFQYDKEDVWAKRDNEENIRELRHWYDGYKQGCYDPKTNFFGLFAMAMYMSEYDNEVALSYFLQTLKYAMLCSNPENVISAIENIASTYILLKKEKLALAYLDLELYLTAKLNNNQFSYCNALLNKAFLFYDLKKYDSSLGYVNNILFDTSLQNYFYPPSYNYLTEKACRIKYLSLDSLGINKDSARYYERYSLNYELDEQQNFGYVLSAEATAIQGWLDRSKNKINTFEVELRKSAELNAMVQKMLRIQSDSLREQATIREQDALSKKHISDSLVQLNDSLIKLKDSLRVKDSTKAVSDIRTANKEVERARNEKYYYIVGGMFGIVLLVYFFNLKNRNRKNKLLAEKNYINSLAMNKFHNFKNDFHVLPNMLNSGQIEKAKIYTDEYGTYQGKFFDNWKKEKITLEDEILLLSQYAKAKEASGQPIVWEVIFLKNGINKKKIKFLQSVFDTLLDNSVRRGFKNKKGICHFCIKIDSDDKYLFCEVTDDGTPPGDSTNYLRKKDSGLNILRSRVELEFKLQNKKVPKDFFSVEKLSENEGTIIKIKIPYEQIA